MRLDEMLGFDPNDPADRHAELLVEEHEHLLRDLIRLREHRHLDQADVAEIMGIDPSGVSRIESGDRDLRLSTLRRYAFAVGAVITHDVQDFDDVLRRERTALASGELRALPTEWSSVQEVAGTRAALDLHR